MKRIFILLLFIITSMSFAQTPLMKKKLVKTTNINGSLTGYVDITIPYSSFALNSGIPWKGAWSAYVYTTVVNGTPGTLNFYTRDADWDGNISLMDSTSIDTSVVLQTGLYILDIHNNKPVYSKRLYIQRQGATGLTTFEVHQAWVEYKE